MEDIDKERLKKNLEYIAENTTNFNKLLNCLTEKQIIDSRQREILQSGKSQYDRNTDLYFYAMKKCPFETLLGCLENSLNGHIAKKLRATKLFQEREKNISHGLRVTGPPCVVLRDEEVRKLFELWENPRNGKGFVSIHGRGGVGKSSLISEFIRLYRDKSDGNCIFINAETSQTATEGIRTLAQKLHISLWDVDHREKNLAPLAAEVYRFLWKSSSILVFNNIDNYEQPLIKSLIQVCANKLVTNDEMPFVILVPQHGLKMDFEFEMHGLELSTMLEETHAVKYFIDNLQLQIDMDDKVFVIIKRLCQILQYYPLAIELASRLISVNNADSLLEDISEYIQEVKEQINEEKPQGIFRKYELDESALKCYLTWRISKKRILENTHSDSYIISMMNTIAFFSADPIQTSFLLDLVKNEEICNEMTVNSYPEILLDYSLIKSGPETDAFCSRKLLQKFSRIDMENDDSITEKLSTLLSAMHTRLRNKSVPVSQISHIISVWNHSTKYKDLAKKHAELPVWISLTLFQNGRWEDAFNFSEMSSKILGTAIGEDNQWTLRLLYWKGRIYFERGLYIDSMNILRDVFQKQVLREYVHHSLITSHRLALIFWKRGDKEKGFKWLDTTLRNRITKFGEEHRNTQFIKHDMASLFSCMGKFPEARKLLEEIYAVRVRILGEDHREAVMTKFHIGQLLREAKNCNEAIGIFKEVKELREKILEPDHRDTIRVKHFMVLTYKSMGRWRVALPLAKEVFEKRVKLLGTEHPYTNYSRNTVRQLEQNLDRSNRPL